MRVNPTAGSKWEQKVSIGYDEDKAVKNRNILVLVIAAVQVALSASLFALYRSMTGPNPVADQNIRASRGYQTPRQQAAARWTRTGTMSVQTWSRLSGIQTKIERNGGRITNSDLQWALALLHSKPVVDSADNENALHQAMFLYLSGLKPLPQPEENEYFAAIVPFVSDTDPSVRAAAAISFREADDLRALPYLYKMQSDPDPQVEQYAAGSIKHIQKHHIR